MTYLHSDELVRRSKIAAARAVNRAAAEVKVTALQRTPMLEGPLRASMRVEDAEVEHLRARISFNTAYAAAQHEGVAYQQRGEKIVHWQAEHWTTPGTGPKYLESALHDLLPRYHSYAEYELRRMF